MIFVRQFLFMTVICLCIATYFMGCASLYDEVLPYDTETYKQAAVVNKKVQKFFVKMAGSDAEHRKYKHHKGTYEDILVELMVLLTRTQARQDRNMAKSVMFCVIDWRSLISAHKGDMSTSLALRKALGTVENREILDNSEVRKVYEDSLSINTAAEPKQLNSKLSDKFLEGVTATFQQSLYNLMSTELEKKEK